MAEVSKLRVRRPPVQCPTCGHRLLPLSDQGVTGKDHPEQSHEAGQSQRLTAPGRQHHQALAVVEEYGTTNASHIGEILGWGPNKTSSRLKELRDRGCHLAYVLDDNGGEMKADTLLGRRGAVHRLTEIGRAKLDWYESQVPLLDPGSWLVEAMADHLTRYRPTSYK